MKNKDLFSSISQEALKNRKKLVQPSFIPPMLATLTTDYFSSKEWIFEEKYDGERCLVFKRNGKVTLKSRSKRVMNDEYPELVEAITKQSADNFIIDGEIAALNKKGISDFQLLQGRINLHNAAQIRQQTKAIPVLYYIFDVMYVDGYDICNLSLVTRKAILKKLLRFTKKLIYSPHQSTDGVSLLKKACKKGWEGLIAKRAQGPYLTKRSSDWLKFKCAQGQELIIIGYTAPQGSRTDFGALLVGYYDKKKLRYAGKVGTGFDQATLHMLGKRLRAIQVSKCPVSDYDESVKGVFWVKPKLVAEFKFAGWTKAKRLRVGRFKGMRDDKKAQDVVKESA